MKENLELVIVYNTMKIFPVRRSNGQAAKLDTRIGQQTSARRRENCLAYFWSL